MFLNNHSFYSLRYGTMSEIELMALAKESGCNTFPLTDINNTSGCLNYIRRAPEYGITPVVGIDFRNSAQQCYVCLATNNEGFLELNNFLSRHLHDDEPFPDEAPVFENAVTIYPFRKLLEIEKYTFSESEYIGVSLDDINMLPFSRLNQHRDRLVLLHTISFRGKRDFNVHRLLRAIDNNLLLSKLPKAQQGKLAHQILPGSEVEKSFKDYPHIIENTSNLLKRCSIEFDFSNTKKSQNLSTLYGSEEVDFNTLKALCYEGLPKRYDEVSKTIEQRLEKELDLIKKQNYVSFFLINWRIIQYAKSKGYYYVGRGSGANSIVAYLLQITDVDPIELDLYFERFMNLYRTTPPDFDIDFSTWDREDVTRFIFEEFKGDGQVALLGAYVTFQYKGAVRELGKVFGLPKYEIDKLCSGKFDYRQLDDLSKLVLRYAKYLEGRPNYVSIHAAGVLISERPIHYFSATNMPPKGFPTVQFDMHIAEDVGLYKFDILGQRGLGKIKDAIAVIEENRPGVELPNIHNAKPFFEDDSINDMIEQGECIGCFYVESPAMRMLIKKLGVRDYLTLVAASSIIRPGVAKSGMMREYILRHKNPERRKRAHPVLWDIMPDTYGVMVYQEDVIKVAHHYAGLDLGEADVLRRGMSGKYRSREEFLAVKEKFISNCREKGERDEVIFEVWRQIESFAGYAFAKGHSASYAVESYQSLFLKHYYPLEYMVATVNNGGGFYRTELYLHEAKKWGGVVHPPCINRSRIETVIVGVDIYLGFQHLQGLERRNMVNILQARVYGNFMSLDDFMERVPMSIEQLDILIRVNAFRSSGIDKRTLLWEAYYKCHHLAIDEMQPQLFRLGARAFELPKFTITQLEDAFDQLELLNFTLYDVFSLLEKSPTNRLLTKDLAVYKGRVVTIYGYLITAKNTSTHKGDRMHFGTFLDQEGEWLDTVHFPPVAKRYPFRGKGVYRIIGKVVEEFDFLSVEVIKQERMAYIADPRFSSANVKNTEQQKISVPSRQAYKRLTT
ncbi:DNA polymerase III subunit alpha [Hyunsoonleella sp. SJ7]|uniref:DNA-directed DNA polymerase n=1 Tax=Hyunsoonleella aquatilis TaxID=2762758 RepID=A0A923HH38_9FLAO|nr:PHP domain-containing protein [Hyunsoonleella aquatilis]MBC3759240.1 DNA polymerase III subunit alpha [Hyunsoonleella aquatilis]